MEQEQEKKKTLAEMIRLAGKKQSVMEFKNPDIPEFYVKLAYASKFVMNQIAEVSRELSNDRMGRKIEKFNDEKLREEYATKIIQGWRGLTSEKAKKLIPALQYDEANKDKDVPYDVDTAMALLEESGEFENWVLTVCVEVSNYSHIAKQKDKEIENLK